MANKERNKRSVRKARAAVREQREQTEAAASDEKKGTQAAKSTAKDTKKQPKQRGALSTYLSDVRTEMHRVVWPSREELKSYSVAVIAALVIFGVVLWVVDTIMTSGIAAITGIGG